MSDIPPYESSLAVRIGTSVAFSQSENERGLESFWYTPYGDALREVLAPWPGKFLVQCVRPLWIPGLHMRELALRKDFTENGLDYDDTPDEVQVQPAHATKRSATSRLINLDAPAQLTSRDEHGSVRTMTLATAAQKKRLEEQQQRKSQLLQKRTALEKDQATAESRPLQGDISIRSVAYSPDGDAYNDCPDVFVAHVEGCELPKPVGTDEKRHYAHRAGIKTHHTCGAIIEEIKAAPAVPPGATSEQRRNATTLALSAAELDLMEYCAVYFYTHAEAKKVVVISAAGPYWRWLPVKRRHVPAWDWVTNRPTDAALADAWQDRFLLKNPVTLGSKASDLQLTKLVREHIYPMLADDHVAPMSDLLKKMVGIE